MMMADRDIRRAFPRLFAYRHGSRHIPKTGLVTMIETAAYFCLGRRNFFIERLSKEELIRGESPPRAAEL
jgi:hypothetical protein